MAADNGTERKTDRLEAFSDAVLAIAITLPVAELKSPEIPRGGDLGGAFADLGSQYAAYAMSVVVIGLYWIYSHFSGKVIRKTDHGYNLLTVLFLALVSVTHFPSRALAEHLTDPVNARTAALAYVSLLSLPGVVMWLRWSYARRRELVDPTLTRGYLDRLSRRYAITAALNGAGILIAVLVDWRVGSGLVALVMLGFFLPPARPVYEPGQEPEDELEEADERD